MKNFGEVITIYGIFGFFIETIVFSIWIGPVKK